MLAVGLPAALAPPARALQPPAAPAPAAGVADAAHDADAARAVDALVQRGRVREARARVDTLLARQATAARAGAHGDRAALDADVARATSALVMGTDAWDTPYATLRLDTARLRGVDLAVADFRVGYAAARRATRAVDVTPGSRVADRRLADSVLARLVARGAAAAASERGALDVMALLVRAELVGAPGRRDSTHAALRAAAARLEALPDAPALLRLVKSPYERASELRLYADRPADALATLDGAPRAAAARAGGMLRRARALDRLGRRDEAVRAYAALDSLWRDADAGHPDRTEVRWGSTPRDPRVAVLDTVGYASGALRLRGMLLRPAAAGRRPAVVLLHGSQGCWDVLDVEGLGGVFATRGYVAFFPCRRGVGLSRGQGVAVMAQIAQEGIVERDARFGARITELLGTTQLDDVLAAVAAVRARGDVDPARVAVAGVSFGGILTLLAAERDSTLRAAVSFAPAAMNWGWNAPLRARLTEAARRTRVPTLFVQAENDWSTEPARALSTAMRAGGGETAARIYPPLGGDVGTGHALMLLAPDLWRDEVFAFLDRHVGAGTAGAAGAAAPVRRTPSGP